MRYNPPVLFVLLLFAPAIMTPVTGAEIVVQSGYTVPPPVGAVPVSPVEVPVWELPLSLIIFLVLLLPRESLLALQLLVPLRYREISSRNVLLQDVRARIYDLIRENPGIHLHGISRWAGIGMGTARYHLKMLLRTHKITQIREAGSIHFFENRGTYTARERQILRHLRNPAARNLIHAILENPEASRHHLATGAGISGSSVTWHIRRLEADGLVISERTGRTVSYRIPEEVAQIIRGYEGTSGETATEAAEKPADLSWTEERERTVSGVNRI